MFLFWSNKNCVRLLFFHLPKSYKNDFFRKLHPHFHIFFFVCLNRNFMLWVLAFFLCIYYLIKRGTNPQSWIFSKNVADSNVYQSHLGKKNFVCVILFLLFFCSTLLHLNGIMVGWFVWMVCCLVGSLSWRCITRATLTTKEKEVDDNSNKKMCVYIRANIIWIISKFTIAIILYRTEYMFCIQKLSHFIIFHDSMFFFSRQPP